MIVVDAKEIYDEIEGLTKGKIIYESDHKSEGKCTLSKVLLTPFGILEVDYCRESIGCGHIHLKTVNEFFSDF